MSRVWNVAEQEGDGEGIGAGDEAARDRGGERTCSTLSVTSPKYALSTMCSWVRNSITISGSVSVSVVEMYVISPRVMWKQYCLPSVVMTSL